LDVWICAHAHFYWSNEENSAALNTKTLDPSAHLSLIFHGETMTTDDAIKTARDGVALVSEILKAAGDNPNVKEAGQHLGQTALTITKTITMPCYLLPPSISPSTKREPISQKVFSKIFLQKPRQFLLNRL
jgi:hypothetical protein